MARSKRVTKKVDYTQFVDPEAGDANDSGSDNDVVMEDVLEDIEDDGMVSEAEDEDEEVDVDEEEDNISFKAIKPKKTKATKQVKPTPTSSTSSKNAKREVVRGKDLTSIKEKLLRFFGSNNEKLVELVNLRKKWEHWVLYFTKKELADDFNSDLPHLDSIPSTEYNAIDKAKYDSKFPLRSSPINLQFEDKTPMQLANEDHTYHEQTLVINTGALITDIAWSNMNYDTNIQTIVVGISNITEIATSEKFKMLGRQSYNSVIQVYQIDIETKQIRLRKSLLHSWGSLWDLKFVPVASEHGVISAVFNDGNIRVISLEDSVDEYLEISKPSYEFHLPGHIISTYDWVDDFKLVCGTDTGNIAEFSIQEPDDLEPSYLYPLHSTYIFSLSAAVSKYDDTLIYSACADGISMIHSNKDITTSINKTARSKLISKSVIYSPQLYSFIQAEGPYSTKAIPSRAIFGSVPLTKHDGSTESLASSKLHPFILSGGADGKIKMGNLARRLLCTPKTTAASLKIITLFELQYGGNEDLFRLIKSNDVEKLAPTDSVSKVNVFPAQVAISSLSWNENKIAGNWLAASSTSGLIILHEI